MLEVKWKAFQMVTQSLQRFVSILVMLEVKWKVIDIFGSIKDAIGFNPCYVGSKMEST